MTTATFAPVNPAVVPNPQFSPYGLFGDLARSVAPVAGQVFGNQQFGGQWGGGLANLMPFGAQPGQYQQYQQYQQHPAAIALQQPSPYGFGPMFADAQAGVQQALVQQAIAQAQAQQQAQQQAQHAIVQQAIAQQAILRHLQHQSPYGYGGGLYANPGAQFPYQTAWN